MTSHVAFDHQALIEGSIPLLTDATHLHVAGDKDQSAPGDSAAAGSRRPDGILTDAPKIGASGG